VKGNVNVRLLKKTTLILSASVLVACVPKQAQIDYSQQYAQTTDQNRAVQSTAEAMDTDDVLGTLSNMLGAKDQYEVATATNVYFVRDLDELSDPAYARYSLRVADNLPVKSNVKAIQQSTRMRVEETLIEYPHSFVAINKQDRIIAVAGDRLEAQALAQKEPRVFYVAKGETLQGTVARWASQSGWNMQWGIEKDYDMLAPATVFGQFAAQGGSLDQLLSTFRYLDAPMKAQFARNRVVVIRENNYTSEIMTVMP
jgi:hypothetical protein